MGIVPASTDRIEPAIRLRPPPKPHPLRGARAMERTAGRNSGGCPPKNAEKRERSGLGTPAGNQKLTEDPSSHPHAGAPPVVGGWGCHGGLQGGPVPNQHHLLCGAGQGGVDQGPVQEAAGEDREDHSVELAPLAPAKVGRLGSSPCQGTPNLTPGWPEYALTKAWSRF